jgi:hypothetical protein
MADLRIDLAAEFRGKKAFKEADKATTSLDKAVGKLGKQIASVFAASKIYAYGKASVKAFAEDEKAALSLSRTVKNLGLEFGNQGLAVNNYISNLEQQTGVLDDELRPALDRLLRSTFSVTKAQELLNLALDISAGTGKSVTQVSQSLQKAYLGQTQALGRLGVGLSKAELTNSSFEKIQKRLTYLFAGQAKDAANSYAGQIDRLTIASNNAKETIGKGLVDALVLASGKDNDVQDLAKAMDSFANYTADAARGLGVLASYFQKIDQIGTGGLLGKILSANFKFGLIGQLAALGQRNSGEGTGQGGSTIDNYRATAAAKAAEAKRVKELIAIQKKQIASQKALTAEQKKQLALKKAGSLFDLEQVQLIAALKGRLSDEDRKRVELQLALLTGNVSEAQKLAYEVAKAAGLTESLARSFANLPAAKNPFEAWDEYLNGLMKKVNAILAGNPVPAAVIPTNITPSSVGTPFGQAGSSQEAAAIRQLGTPFGQAGGNGSGYIGTPFGQAQPIVVQIDGKTVASALQDTSMSGIPSAINRTYGSFAGR